MRILVALATMMLLFPGRQAFADAEADQLREALRSAILQSRQAEDARAEIEAKLTKTQQDAARDKSIAAKKLSVSKAETKKLDQDLRDTIDQSNKRLQERDDALEKWKSAYEEAANVARAKDAERAKFEAEAASFKASTKSCGDKNKQLVKEGQEVVRAYKALTIGDALSGREPVLGLGKVGFENKIQDFGDKILDQKVNP